MTDIKLKFWNHIVGRMSGVYTLEELHKEEVNWLIVHPLQFTGLHDKKGKEIWQGDVVRCGYGTGVIVFKSGCFMIEWIEDKEANLEFVFSRKGTYRREGDEALQVIGNIYENTDLLR